MRISKRAGAAMVGLLALAGVVDLQAPREASEMTEYYFYCGSSDDQTRRACDAVATALESHYLPAGETLTRRETRAFGAEEGLHIRLMFAIKSRYAIAGNLIWQVVRDGRPLGLATGPELRTETVDGVTHPAAYRGLALALVQESGLPGEFGRGNE